MSACHKIESKRFCFGYYYYRTFKIGIETWSFLLTSLLQREQANASTEKMNAAARFDTYYLSVARWPKVVSSDDLFARRRRTRIDATLVVNRITASFLASHLA